MIFIAGRRLLGRVEAYGGTFVVTEFAHLYYLPLAPVRSHLVLETNPAGGIRRSLPLRLHRASAIAGYLRTWSIVGVGVILMAARAAAHPLVWLLFALALAALGAWSQWRLGRVSDERKAQYQTYATLTRVPADAALLGGTADTGAGGLMWRDTFPASLRANVAEGARGLMSTGYRSALDPTNDWAEVALDPTVHDRSFLEACLTLARLDWARSEGAARARLEEQHERIWEKLKAL